MASSPSSSLVWGPPTSASRPLSASIGSLRWAYSSVSSTARGCGSPRLRGLPVCRAAFVHPAEGFVVLPCFRPRCCCLRCREKQLGPRELSLSGLVICSPITPVPSHRHGIAARVARLGSGLAGSSLPGGTCTRRINSTEFQCFILPSSRSRIAWSHPTWDLPGEIRAAGDDALQAGDAAISKRVGWDSPGRRGGHRR